MTATTEETLSVSGILLSKTFGQQANSIEKFRGLNKRLARLQIRQAMVGRWFFMIIGTIFSIMPAFVYWLAGTLAANGSPDAPTAGAIVAFTTLQSRLFFPLGQLLNIQVEIQGSLALFDRIFEYLEMDPEIVDAPDAVPLARATTARPGALPRRLVPVPDRGRALAAGPRRGQRPGTRSPSPSGRRRCELAIEARDADAEAIEAGAVEATVAAADAVAAAAVPAPVPFGLDHVDFTAEPGELVALVGPSGSGKTTTTYLVSRLYDVDSGAVEIDDIDVRRIKLASLGEIIGAVTQETYLFHASVRDNLRYAQARGDRGRARSPPRRPPRSTTG